MEAVIGIVLAVFAGLEIIFLVRAVLSSGAYAKR